MDETERKQFIKLLIAKRRMQVALNQAQLNLQVAESKLDEYSAKLEAKYGASQAGV